MNDKNNKLLWVAGGLAVLIVALAIQSQILTERITNKVIQKLQREYGPSPYGPGFDPDKVGPPPARAR
jgi:hypothetical protein